MKKTIEYKTGIYIRLSKEDCDRQLESESIVNQRNFILNFMKENNYNLSFEYVDDGYSGTSFNRPAFKKMIQDIECNKLNLIITKDMSRLGRDYIEAGYYIEKYFPEKGVRYIAINDGIDTFIESASNDFLPFKAVLNDLYAKDISKKIKASLITKKKQGLFLGPLAPYGYKKDSKNKYKLIIDPIASKVVQKIFEMFLKENSLQTIAYQLTKENVLTPSRYKNIKTKSNYQTKNIWDATTILEILKNPNYTGDLTQNRRKKINYKSSKIIKTQPRDWIIVKNTHQPIISKEKFNLVQNLISKNKNICNPKPLLLKGFLFCKECNHKLGINKSGDQKRHYTICNYYKKYSKYGFCTCHSMRYEELEKLVLDEIKKISSNLSGKNMGKELNKYFGKQKSVNIKNFECQSIKNKIINTKRKLEEIYLDKLDKKITIELYEKIKHQLIEELNDNNKLIEQLEAEKIITPKDKNIESIIKEIISFKNPSRKLIVNIIDKIVIDQNKNIEIYYKIKN